MLSKIFCNQLFERISTETSYRIEEFDIKSTEESYTITLVYNKNYFFRIKKEKSFGNQTIVYSYSPGEFLETETKKAELSQENYSASVLNWLHRIDEMYLEDAKIRSISKKVELQKQQLEILIEKVDAMPNSTFSDDESQIIISRLDQLEADLKSNAAAMNDETAELKAELHKIQQEVETLKNTINSLSKKGWLKLFAIKLFNWSKKPENREMISVGIDVAKELLPEVKDMIK